MTPSCRNLLVAQLVKNPPAMWETWVRSLGWEDSPGEGNGYPLHYSGLENSMDYSMGSQRVGHDWVTFTSLSRAILGTQLKERELVKIIFIKIFSLNSLYFCSFSFTKLSLMKAQGKKILIFRVIWKRHHTVLILTSEGPLFTTCYSKGTMFLKFHVDFISFQVLECSMGFPGGSDGKESSYNVGNLDSIPGLGRFPWRRKWRPTLFLLEKSHGQKSRGVAKSLARLSDFTFTFTFTFKADLATDSWARAEEWDHGLSTWVTCGSKKGAWASLCCKQ